MFGCHPIISLVPSGLVATGLRGRIRNPAVLQGLLYVQ